MCNTTGLDKIRRVPSVRMADLLDLFLAIANQAFMMYCRNHIRKLFPSNPIILRMILPLPIMGMLLARLVMDHFLPVKSMNDRSGILMKRIAFSVLTIS